MAWRYGVHGNRRHPGAPAMRHPALSRFALAAAFLVGASAASAHATGPTADRWEARGDRIDARLDHRADVAEAHGREHRANRLDHRGDRLERRADRIGQRRQSRRG
jgi:hypothetical protein